MKTSKMLAEMGEQPALFDENAERLYDDAPSLGRPDLIVLAARGSSDNACVYARYLFEAKLGIPVSLAAPSVLTRYGADLHYPNCFGIGVSQSAAAPDVAEILRHVRSQNHPTLSITNETRGPVVEAAEHNMLLGAGQEHSIAATKTFTLSLLAFYQLARRIGADLQAPQLRTMPMDDPLAEEFGNAVAHADIVVALGRGFHFSVALEGALKLMECALIPAKPLSIADFAHGPMALAGPGMVALLFGADERDETAKSIRERLHSVGATVLQVPVDSGLTEELRPIPATIWAQRIAYFAAIARGVDPDEPRHISKVTRTR